MHKILILGRGFIGTKLFNFLTEKNLDVLAFNQNVLDYTNEYRLSSFLREYNFSHIINCCGYTGVPNVDGCELNKELCWKYNVVVPQLIDKLSLRYGIKAIHISSGCIYTGYEKAFEETDVPNFGLFNPSSSFYSKTKHAFETVFEKQHNVILRIRMPFTSIRESKNYLYKIFKYDNLISSQNSLTSIDDLNEFILKFLDRYEPGIYNVVNTQSMCADEIVSLFKSIHKVNENWKFVEIKDLDIVAGRSNCVLSTDKIKRLGLELPDTFVSVEKSIKLL